MATDSRVRSNSLEKLSWYLSHKTHSAWDRFSPQQQLQMVEEDLAAGKNVSLVLVSLVTAGMLLCIGTVLVVVLTS